MQPTIHTEKTNKPTKKELICQAHHTT